ncbi:MAG: hypothetical protein JXA99_08705 [Candidatus Lokiarchaeota archaeon]|nr:hypothetical protein [Candidatus Lokiarchaeota archaeon]
MRNPVDRFGQGTLCLPDPPIEVQQFLERTETRTVNKFREISYQGYKIQVDLLPRTKVTVVDMLETIRIEYKERVIREINKNHLTKVVKIKRQNGATKSSFSETTCNSENIEKFPTLPIRKTHKQDDEGYYHRKVSGVGNFKVNNLVYYLDQNRAGQEILIQITENVLRVHDHEKVLLGTLDKRKGRKYP